MRARVAVAAISVTLAFGLTGRAALAQAVRGSVVDAAGVPVPGVVVQLLADSVLAARALTDARGQFLVVAQQAGTYRVRTLRIGYQPVLSEPILLRVGEEVARRVELAGVSLRLDTVRVAGESACGATGSVGGMTLALWEQARAAITATAITGGSRAVVARRILHDRMLDAAAYRTLSQSASVVTAPLTQPWPAESPENLHRYGYIVTVLDSTAYRAPGLDMLASPYFFGDHCFKLASGRDRALIGLEFTPAPDRRKLAEIRGTIWLDRATAALRRIEFRYVNPEARDTEAGARGEINFAALPNGAWVVTQWSIRMPVLEVARAVNRVPGRPSGAESQVRVAAVRVMGGELALATEGPDTLFAKAPLVLAGTLTDSATGRDVSGASVALVGTPLTATTGRDGRFAVSGVLPGEYVLEVRTASLDSVGTVHRVELLLTDPPPTVRVRVPTAAQVTAVLCGTPRQRATPRITGVVLGGVLGPDSTPLRTGARIQVQWVDVESGHARLADTQADSTGAFRICGVPLHSPLTLRALSPSAASAAIAVAVGDDRRIARASLVLDRPAVGSAVLTGLVADSAGGPVPGAEVTLPALGLARIADGRGAFRVSDIPAGVHQVIVRKVGYGPLDATLGFADGATLERRIILTRMTTLGEVRVTATLRDRQMEDFEANRRTGLGHFLTRAEIAPQEVRKISDVMQSMPGVKVVHGPGNRAFIATSRRCLQYTSEQDCAACIASVYLDGVLMSQFEPVDINTFSLRDIEAIEYYADWWQAPPRYNGFQNACGVVVIHTRRGAP